MALSCVARKKKKEGEEREEEASQWFSGVGFFALWFVERVSVVWRAAGDGEGVGWGFRLKDWAFLQWKLRKLRLKIRLG